MPLVVATFGKNARETVRVALDEFRGVQLIDMRICVELETSKVLTPTKKGLSLRVDLLPQLAAALQKAEAEARSQGLIGGEVIPSCSATTPKHAVGLNPAGAAFLAEISAEREGGE